MALKGWHSCRYLHRPYARVDRAKLKRKLLERCRDQGVLLAKIECSLARLWGGKGANGEGVGEYK